MTTVFQYPMALIASLTLGASTSAWAAGNDMQGMDHSQMPGMDHSQMPGMDHSQMQGMDSMQGMEPMQSAPTTSRTPIPALTAADRAAVYEDHGLSLIHI